MTEIAFLVQGRDPKPYEATFAKSDGGDFYAKCTCKAGIFGGHCKHRLDIIGGSTKGIVSENLSEVETIQSWVEGSQLEAAYTEYRSLEVQTAALAKAVKANKVEIAKLLNPPNSE